MSLETGKELETGECKLWTEKSIGEGVIACRVGSEGLREVVLKVTSGITK